MFLNLIVLLISIENLIFFGEQNKKQVNLIINCNDFTCFRFIVHQQTLNIMHIMHF
jgi:hypothetical protein